MVCECDVPSRVLRTEDRTLLVNGRIVLADGWIRYGPDYN